MIEIPHSNDCAPSTWKGALINKRRTALLTCRNGHTCSLSQHEIAADGRVTPSCVCPQFGCDFHEWVLLVGWKAAA